MVLCVNLNIYVYSPRRLFSSRVYLWNPFALCFFAMIEPLYCIDDLCNSWVDYGNRRETIL